MVEAPAEGITGGVNNENDSAIWRQTTPEHLRERRIVSHSVHRQH
jgi:hypothetical protein